MRPVVFLDMDETLLYYSVPDNVIVRPGAKEALRQLSKVADLWVYSAGYPSYVRFCMDQSGLMQFIEGIVTIFDFPGPEWIGARRWVLIDDGATSDMKVDTLTPNGEVILVDAFDAETRCSPLTAYVPAAIQALR